MTDKEKKQALDESIQYFEDMINKVLIVAGTTEGLEELNPMEIIKHYNLVRQEVSKLYVDLD
jgi:hypothetical protein